MPGVELAHQPDHQERQPDDQRIVPVREMRVIVDEGIAARLVDGVEQRVPAEQRQHLVGQVVRHKHLARGDHVGAGIDRLHDADEPRRPGLGRKEHEPERHPGEPRQQHHPHRADPVVDLDRPPGGVVDVEHHHHRQHLQVKRTQRRGGDRDGGGHRRVFHHRRGRAFGAEHRAHRLGVGQVEEDPAHDVEQEVAADRVAAQAEHRIHHVKAQHEQEGLHHVAQQTEDGIALRAADMAHRRMVDQLQQAEGRPEGALAALRPEHAAALLPGDDSGAENLPIPCHSP
ncbi:hypothetical protein SDC9_06492 [bioreactor metagenome]|uniref:Uncharacterized protein n=1 Tax=bioreactor metagenome TaxID=1076179 RepID=A0A644T355_9ZZZZ